MKNKELLDRIVDFHKEHNISEEGIRRCLQGKQSSIKGWKFESIGKDEEI